MYSDEKYVILIVKWVVINRMKRQEGFCMKKKRSVYNDSKLILIIPYILVLIMTPFYGILDRLVFVEVFGCGCVPDVQENMFGIPFNANDLRFTVYAVVTALMTVLGIKLSKSIPNKWIKLVYAVSILVFNAAFGLWICKVSMWK